MCKQINVNEKAYRYLFTQLSNKPVCFFSILNSNVSEKRAFKSRLVELITLLYYLNTSKTNNFILTTTEKNQRILKMLLFSNHNTSKHSNTYTS